jgi:ATP-binding cassette subfamily B protein
MVLATVWFSGQARKAFRRARREIGGVTADLQENIAGVREAQASPQGEYRSLPRMSGQPGR